MLPAQTTRVANSHVFEACRYTANIEGNYFANVRSLTIFRGDPTMRRRETAHQKEYICGQCWRPLQLDEGCNPMW